MATAESIDRMQATVQALEAEVAKVIIGQQELIRGVVIALVARGHVLLEGAPGLGKTMLVRTVADALRLDFSRIQFTPDLMPSDITGTVVLVDSPAGGRTFRFEPGPVFANIVLADEINRGTPRTQSALLEAMQEQTVTVAKEAHSLPQPFFVLATQNPIEMEGTYPLPEAQLDRFLFKLVVQYPSAHDLTRIVTSTTGGEPPRVARVADGAAMLRVSALAREVPVASHVLDYAVRLVLATHPDRPSAPKVTTSYVRYGASPRGAQALVLAGRIRALLEGRLNVAFDDIRWAALPALRHRVILNLQADVEGVTTDRVVGELLQRVPEE